MNLQTARIAALDAVQSALLLQDRPPLRGGCILLPPTSSEIRLILSKQRVRSAKGARHWLICARKRDTYLYLIGLMDKFYEVEAWIIAPRIALVGSRQRFARSETSQDFVIHERDFLAARRRDTICVYEDRWDLLKEFYDAALQVEKEDPLIKHEWFKHEHTRHEIKRKLRQEELGTASKKQLMDEAFDRMAIEDDPDVIAAMQAIKDLGKKGENDA